MRIKEESKGARQIQPVISSLSVLHCLEHTKRFTELGREEKGEGGDRGNLVDKKESQKGDTYLLLVPGPDPSLCELLFCV